MLVLLSLNYSHHFVRYIHFTIYFNCSDLLQYEISINFCLLAVIFFLVQINNPHSFHTGPDHANVGLAHDSEPSPAHTHSLNLDSISLISLVVQEHKTQWFLLPTPFPTTKIGFVRENTKRHCCQSTFISVLWSCQRWTHKLC